MDVAVPRCAGGAFPPNASTLTRCTGRVHGGAHDGATARGVAVVSATVGGVMVSARGARVVCEITPGGYRGGSHRRRASRRRLPHVLSPSTPRGYASDVHTHFAFGPRPWQGQLAAYPAGARQWGTQAHSGPFSPPEATASPVDRTVCAVDAAATPDRAVRGEAGESRTRTAGGSALRVRPLQLRMGLLLARRTPTG